MFTKWLRGTRPNDFERIEHFIYFFGNLKNLWPPWECTVKYISQRLFTSSMNGTLSLLLLTLILVMFRSLKIFVTHIDRPLIYDQNHCKDSLEKSMSFDFCNNFDRETLSKAFEKLNCRSSLTSFLSLPILIISFNKPVWLL